MEFELRSPVAAKTGMVATSQPVAVQAGLAMLKVGGTAVDAALAMASTLTVVEPTSNGIGGDAFALVWDGATLHGYNGSGRSPAALTRDQVLGAGHQAMPPRGWLPVTTPGAPRTWRDLHARFGRLSFDEVLAPAIEAAEHGFEVTPTVGHWWDRAAKAYASHTADEYAGWWATFTREGRSPRVGETWRLPDHARTLRAIARSKSDDFYTGELARRVADFAKATGGLLSADDLASNAGEWVSPIRVRYRDHDVWEIPPNGQGIAALMALQMLEGFDLAALARESVEAYHLQIEAMKIAFADAHRHIADPTHMTIPASALLADDYAARRRAMITPVAQSFLHGDPLRGGTVYLCAADAGGMMVSFIQSNYSGFGSGIVVPGTGIALQNRGSGFSLDADHPNVVAPMKRPFHTIIPGFLTREGHAVGPFGVMGGHMQPQGHVQVILNTLDWRMNPQASLDVPRWHWLKDRSVVLEAGIDQRIIDGLTVRGHAITIEASSSGTFGRGQIIWREPDGHYLAGSERRADGRALGF